MWYGLAQLHGIMRRVRFYLGAAEHVYQFFFAFTIIRWVMHP